MEFYSELYKDISVKENLKYMEFRMRRYMTNLIGVSERRK